MFVRLVLGGMLLLEAYMHGLLASVISDAPGVASRLDISSVIDCVTRAPNGSPPESVACGSSHSCPKGTQCSPPDGSRDALYAITHGNGVDPRLCFSSHAACVGGGVSWMRCARQLPLRTRLHPKRTGTSTVQVSVSLFSERLELALRSVADAASGSPAWVLQAISAAVAGVLGLRTVAGPWERRIYLAGLKIPRLPALLFNRLLFWVIMFSFVSMFSVLSDPGPGFQLSDHCLASRTFRTGGDSSIGGRDSLGDALRLLSTITRTSVVVVNLPALSYLLGQAVGNAASMRPLLGALGLVVLSVFMIVLQEVIVDKSVSMLAGASNWSHVLN